MIGCVFKCRGVWFWQVFAPKPSGVFCIWRIVNVFIPCCPRGWQQECYHVSLCYICVDAIYTVFSISHGFVCLFLFLGVSIIDRINLFNKLHYTEWSKKPPMLSTVCCAGWQTDYSSRWNPYPEPRDLGTVEHGCARLAQCVTTRWRNFSHYCRPLRLNYVYWAQRSTDRPWTAYGVYKQALTVFHSSPLNK